MLSLTQIARESMKTRVRAEFMQMVVHQLHPAATSRFFPDCSDIRVREVNFRDIFRQLIFRQLMWENRIDDVTPDMDVFDFLIWDETETDRSEYVRFVCSILSAYNMKRVVYMSFLAFVVKRNHALARLVFRNAKFTVAYCLIYDNFSMDDYKQIAAWDLEIGSDIFRNASLPVVLYACDSALIQNAAFDKMKQLAVTHGPDIMLWTSSDNERTNVNIFLQRGYIFNTEGRHRMEEKLAFMIDVCPAALKQHVIRHGQKENAFTTVLSRCTDASNERSHMIVGHVFGHVQIQDLHEQYTELHTLLDLVRMSGNAVVTQYLERKFGRGIFATAL